MDLQVGGDDKDAMDDIQPLDGIRTIYPMKRSRAITGPLLAAVVCTVLIIDAVATALGARANGDMMVMVCPILGIIFLAIPAIQAWMACSRIWRGGKSAV
jgi:Na+/citrate or Na+/malate symporter